MDRETTPQLCLSADALRQWFNDILRSAAEQHRLDLDEHTEAYVVDLLARFTERGALKTEQDQDLLEQPLAIQVLRARSAETTRRFQIMRQVGDVSLYLTGFFGERVDAGVIDRSYYVDMGSGAYRQAAGAVAGGSDNPFRRLYEVLAARFVDLMLVLNEVSERCFRADTDVLRLYDRYLATGSERLVARLAQMGVAVGTGPRLVR